MQISEFEDIIFMSMIRVFINYTLKSLPVQEIQFLFSSTLLRQKPNEAAVHVLEHKGLSVGSGRQREMLESLSDESFSQTQSETEQSDVECRVHALKVCSYQYCGLLSNFGF